MKNTINAAIKALQARKIILLTDPIDRENEGDMVFPAEIITPEIMSFMIQYGTGIVCVSLDKETIERLNLPLMVPMQENTAQYNTAFTIPVDAKAGVSSGVSASDRTHTILEMMKETSVASDFTRPGHVYPLAAKEGGVLARKGHTEGALDLVRLAGFKSGAVICEAIHLDGSMVKGSELIEFAKKHDLAMVSIDDLVDYQAGTENIIEDLAYARMPTEKFGEWDIYVFREKYTGTEHTVLYKKVLEGKTGLIRLHSCCQPSDLFGSLLCDCQSQLHYAMARIQEEGGALLYLNQEGRGIGLLNTIKAYALQEKGLNTIEANVALGLPVDARDYRIVPSVLRYLNLTNARLLTGNPEKLASVYRYGLMDITHEKMPDFVTEYNEKYLAAKMDPRLRGDDA